VPALLGRSLSAVAPSSDPEKATPDLAAIRCADRRLTFPTCRSAHCVGCRCPTPIYEQSGARSRRGRCRANGVHRSELAKGMEYAVL
jgi:hypothetical protein